MENHFSRLGQLIFDLSNGQEFDLSDESNFTFLDEEYRRITIALRVVWQEQEMGWPYLLEFHAAEGERLLQKLRIDRIYHELIEVYDQKHQRLKRAYNMLFHILTELIKRINILRYEKNINIDMFNVN